MINEIGLGIAGGLAYGLSCFAKKKMKGDEKFDWKKLCATLAVSVVIGVVAGLTGQSEVSVLFEGMGGTMLVENVYKAFLKD